MLETDEKGVIDNVRRFLYNYYSDKTLWKKDTQTKVKYTETKQKLWRDDNELLREIDDWESYFHIAKESLKKRIRERDINNERIEK